MVRNSSLATACHKDKISTSRYFKNLFFSCIDFKTSVNRMSCESSFCATVLIFRKKVMFMKNKCMDIKKFKASLLSTSFHQLTLPQFIMANLTTFQNGWVHGKFKSNFWVFKLWPYVYIYNSNFLKIQICFVFS